MGCDVKEQLGVPSSLRSRVALFLGISFVLLSAGI